jgi:hypothetical protein
VLVTSTGLAGVCYGGLNFWDVAEGWVFCGFGDGGEGLSGWLLECGLVFVRGLG